MFKFLGVFIEDLKCVQTSVKMTDFYNENVKFPNSFLSLL